MFALFFVGVDGFGHSGAAAVPALEITIAVAAAWLLVRRGARATSPLIPVDLMRIPVFALSVVTSVCSFTAYMLAFVSLPFYFETVLHRDQVQTGLLMTPWPVALGARGAAGRLALRSAVERDPGRRRPCHARGRPDAPCRAAARRLERGHRLAHGGVRRRVRLLPVAQQSHHAVLRAAPAGGCGQRHAGDGAARRADRWAPRWPPSSSALRRTAPEMVDLLVGTGFAAVAAVVSLLRLSNRTPATALATR